MLIDWLFEVTCRRQFGGNITTRSHLNNCPKFLVQGTTCMYMFPLRVQSTAVSFCFTRWLTS